MRHVDNVPPVKNSSRIQLVPSSYAIAWYLILQKVSQARLNYCSPEV